MFSVGVYYGLKHSSIVGSRRDIGGIHPFCRNDLVRDICGTIRQYYSGNTMFEGDNTIKDGGLSIYFVNKKRPAILVSHPLQSQQ